MRKKQKEVVENQSNNHRYPTLSEQIDTLKARALEAHGQQAILINKWVERLELTEKEMRHLERIENFKLALKEKKEG